jgi:putative inorganic carbon (HCO3(-)) transporter
VVNRNNFKPIIESEKATYLSYLTGAYLFFFYMEASLRWPAFEAIRFHFVFGLILTVLCSFKYLSSKQTIVTRNGTKRTIIAKDDSRPLLNAVYLFLAVLGIYAFASMAREISTDIYINRVIKFALISFFIVTSVEKVKDLQVIVIFLLLAWFKISSEGFIGWVTGSQMWVNQGVGRLHGSSPFVGHPNSFSAFGVGCLAFSLYLYKAFQDRFLKIMIAAIVVFSFVIIIFTGSRSGYVAVVLASIYVFFKMKEGKLKVLFISLVVLIALAPVIPEQYYERFESIYTGKAKEGNSSNTRTIIMTDALKIYVEYPLGIGIQAFSTVRMDMFGRLQNIHMLYLEILTNLGPLGLIMFFIFIRRMFYLNKISIAKTEKLLQGDKPAKGLIFLQSLSKAIMVYMILRLIFGLFAMDLYEPHWWLMLGLTLAVHKLLTTCKGAAA